MEPSRTEYIRIDLTRIKYIRKDKIVVRIKIIYESIKYRSTK